MTHRVIARIRDGRRTFRDRRAAKVTYLINSILERQVFPKTWVYYEISTPPKEPKT